MTEDDERLSEEAAIVNDNMNAEERDILERFERDELPSAPGAEREVKEAHQAARNTCISAETVGADILTPHFPYQPCRACRNQQQNYLM